MPKWRVVDIRGTSSTELDAYEVKGSWEHWDNDSLLRIANYTATDFSVKDAPCHLSGKTRIEKGATGTYEASTLPWSLRLEEALSFLQMDGPAIAVMDAPPPAHICEALITLRKHNTTISKFFGTDKLLILSGSYHHQLPTFVDHEEDPNEKKTPCFQIILSTEPWEEMKRYFNIFVETPAAHALDRLHAPFGMLIGSYTLPNGPTPVTFEYPTGSTVPTKLIPFVTYSAGVSKPRLSRTQGITAMATSPKDAIATAIVEVSTEDEPDKPDEPEHEVLTQLRHILGKDTAQKGAAYFLLREVLPTSKYYSIAMNALTMVDITIPKFGRSLALGPPRPPPLARVQSYNNSWQ